MKLRCYSENKTVFLSVFYDLVLRSSSGVSLVNDTTTISASVYYSNDNELVNFDNSCFTWYNDGYDSVFKTGKSFQLSKADFASDSLTLKCTFNHPESSYQRSEYITITKASNGYSRAVIQLFKRSASKPSNYDGDVLEYTFSTNEISGSTGTWSKTIPSGEYPLYVVYATAFSNASKDTISTGEWTPPAILAEHGTDGSPGPTTFSLVLYQRKASAPDKPTGNVTYNIKSGAVSGAGSWTKEFPNGSDPCWVISATASTYTDSDEITPSEWSSVQKLVENGKNGADAKLIRLSADKTIFSLDSNGRPYAGQVATVTVDKQGIADTHRITGTVSAPDNATEFKVTPQMMGLNPIELTNLLGDGYADNVSVTNTWSSTATFNGFYKSSVSSAKTLLGGHIYYCKIDFEYVSSTLSTLGLHSCYPLYLANASRRRDFSAIYAGESKTIGNITKPTTDSSSQYNYYFYFTEGFAGQTVNLKINRSIYDITNLVSSSPKLQAMTDVELQTWCETYIPIVGANSTWTIGGKAEQMLKQMELDGTNSSAFQRLQNVTYNSNGITFPNDTVDSYYFANYKQTIKAGTVIYSALNQTAYSAGYLYANINNTQRIYEPRAKIGRISCIYPLNKDQTALTVDDGTSSPPSVMTINKQMAIDLTTSGWLAQLSLMGIETDEAIKNWIDTYIPFFDGELDFPRFPSIEIKATAGSYTDYLTIGTQIQPRTLRLSSSPISIELDAEGHSDEEVTVTAHTQNIYGDIFWSNDRGLPVAKGNEQRFRASQLGLKPITLTRLDKEYLYAYYGSNTMSNGIYTFTGTINDGVLILHPTDDSNGISAEFADSNIWFGRAKIKNLASSSSKSHIQINSGTNLAGNTYTLATNEEAYCYVLCTFYEAYNRQLLFRCKPTDTSVNPSYQLSEITFVPVTELLAHPHLQAMTDAQKLEWLNTYIPTIGTGESWTIGGKAKNLLDNPTSSDDWICGTSVTDFSASNGIVKGTSALALSGYSEGWLKKAINSPIHIGDSLYVHISSISATNTYSIGQSYWKIAENTNSGVMSITRTNPEDYYLTIASFRGASTTITVDTTKGVNFINLTTSGWLAQLSLMGIEGADTVKAWIDDNVPFFVGEFDFPAYRDVTWTAEYEEVADSVTVGAKKNDFKIVSSHESYALSPRGVCKNRQTMTFHVDALGLTEQPSWRIYYDGEVVEQDIKGNTVSWTLEINETPRTITAEVTSGNYYDILTLNAMVNGNPMPERVTGGYSSRMIPQDEIRSIKALDDGVSPLIEGDYALVAIINNEGKTEPTPYRYSGVQWTALGGNESNASEIFFALQNDAWATDDTMATARIIIAWIKNLISQNAFIENLKIANAFSSTNYEEDANGMPVSGWKGDTDSGTLKSHKMVTHGMTAYDATVQGNIEHDSLKTIEAKSGDLDGTWADSTKTHWSFKSLMEGVPRYTGAAGTYHNAFRSGSITYNGVTYDQYYSKMWESTPERPHPYTYNKHLGKASGGHILGGGESGESVSSIASHMGITLQSNEAVRLNFHCSGATTRFDFYINGQLSYSEKVDGVGVFNGWLRPSDIVRIYCYNSNIFNERDLTCTVTLYQMGYPMQPLTTAPANLGPGVPADIGEDGEATTSYAEKSWTVPTDKLINQAWVSFNADVFCGFETSAELRVNNNVIAIFDKNTDWYKINWKATVKGGDTITLRVYSIRPSADPTTYYYCRAYGVVCAFGYINNAKGLYLQQSSGNETLVLPFYAESEPAGWTDKSISTSLATVTKQYLIGDKFINTLVTAWGSANMNREIICASSKIIVDGVETAIDRVRLTDEGLSYRTTAGVWKSIVKLSQMGLYKSLSLTVATLAQILSIETASVVPKVDYAYQIGTPEKRFNSSYIKEHHINGWRMSVSNGELTFIYEG